MLVGFLLNLFKKSLFIITKKAKVLYLIILRFSTKYSCFMLYTKLSKKFLNTLIVQYLPSSPLGRKPKIPTWRIVKMIIYRLKTGCQWRELPVKMFCRKTIITWQSVYYHFNKWSNLGIWRKVWIAIISKYKSILDLSSIQLDGSHTPAKNGGESVSYQGRKKAKTSNMLILTDKNGQILGLSEPISGQHHDLYDIKKMSDKIFKDLQEAEIDIDGLFLNADAGFDSQDFRCFCEQKGIHTNFDINRKNLKNEDYAYLKDEKLYKDRFVVERTNAWFDAFKALLVRFEKLNQNWRALHYLASLLILIKYLF